jgi:hypothetical protein
MAHTLCFSGMDRAEEARLKLLFADANEWLGGEWTLAPENDAEVLVIDLESMYGHMTWLKVHNSNRYVIALTSRAESEAEHLLLRPVSVESMVSALSAAIGQSVPRKPEVSSSEAMTSSQQAGAMAPSTETSTRSRIGKPLAEMSAPPAQSGTVSTGEHPAMPAAAAVVSVAPERPSAPSTPPRPPAAPPAKRDPVLWDYLQQGKLAGPSKLELDGAPALVIDPQSDTYIGGITLKPYIPYCELGSVGNDRWQPVSADELKRLSSELGGAQPLARLRWLHALVQGGGELAPGYDPGDKFRLTRWPKTEREYPRHFRIATVMMQAPSTPAEIAAQSNASLEEVNDFLNASLDSGFAEPFTAPPTTPDAPPKSSGLLGRLRGR